MALEPYRPRDTQYRDELDRELDQKIDQAFNRWPWKVRRLFIRVVMVVGAIWLALQIVPAAINFVANNNVAQALLQVLMMGAYLFFFIGFQFFLMFYFMGRTRIYWLKPGETGIGFKDYKGNPEVLEAARRIVTLLRGAKEFKDMGGEVTRGVLLIGPPGTGKSYMAQAVATEAGVPFGYLSAPSLTSAWMGMGNMKVMLLYRKARKFAREYGACILFIDEIDAIGMARSSSLQGQGAGAMGMNPAEAGGLEKVMMGMGGMGAGSGLLNELLIQMDPPPHEQTLSGKIMRFFGLRKKRVEMPPVLTMGATNLAETLDAALLRPGRFDRKITVDLPDPDGRKEIIEYYLAKVKHEPMPLDRMVSDTIGYSPVAIKFVINEGVIHAHFDGRQAINYWDFTKARETHEWGLSQPIRSMSYEERVCDGQAAAQGAPDQGDDRAARRCARLRGLEALGRVAHPRQAGAAQPDQDLARQPRGRRNLPRRPAQRRGVGLPERYRHGFLDGGRARHGRQHLLAPGVRHAGYGYARSQGARRGHPAARVPRGQGHDRAQQGGRHGDRRGADPAQ
jgi:cell division protease FtsH